jgi:hypothetical protein
MNPGQDAEHLRLLSIFHYVVAGVLALFSLFPVVHLVVGIALVTGAFENIDHGNPPPAFVGWIFIIVPSMFILCGLTLSTCIAIAGYRLRRHTRYLFCLVVAGIECIFVPFGTVLGVFTIVVLMNPTVKELFGVAGSVEGNPPPIPPPC